MEVDTSNDEDEEENISLADLANLLASCRETSHVF
jgi:hypothetical protein